MFKGKVYVQMRSRKADVEGVGEHLPRPGDACGLHGVG